MIPFSDEELIEPVLASIDVIRPYIENDGGGIELVGIKDGVVYVRLSGHCVGCAASDTTLKNGVERQIRIDIHPELVVKNVGADFKL